MNRCWPLSTVSPVRGSLKEYALPPKCGFFSSTVTRAPFSASAVAQASPANPPPSTTMSEDAITVEDGGRRPSELAPWRKLNALKKDPIVDRLDLVEHAFVDPRHDLGRQRGRAVASVQAVAGALIKGLRPVVFEVHEAAK